MHVSLDSLWGSAATGLRERLLEAKTPGQKFRVPEKTLLERAANSLAGHPALDFALKQFRKSPNVRAIASVTKGTGLSKRRFIQLFAERVGLTPKLFCRVQRFQGVLKLIASGGRIDWADLAVQCGYYDQSHFIHDFTSFSGLSPSAYLDSRTEHPTHVRLE